MVCLLYISRQYYYGGYYIVVYAGHAINRDYEEKDGKEQRI